MSSQYNLHDAVASVLDTTNLTEPAEIAAKVAENVPSRELRRVVGELLPAYVREVNRHRRNLGLTSENANQSARSSKVAAFRAIGRAWLRNRIQVESGWKLLADCSYEDLMWAAENRRQIAAQNFAKAEEYEALAQHVQAHGVDRLADLPDAALDELEAGA